MNTRAIRVLLTWNAALTVLLVIALGAVASYASASSDPPVHIYSSEPQHQGGADGGGTNTDVIVDGAATWDILAWVSVDYSSQSHNHHCVVVASSEAHNPGGSNDNQYVFDITMDSTSGNTSTTDARSIEFDDNADIDDVGLLEVSSTQFFADVSNTAHTFRWLAKKAAAGDANMTVERSTLTVICLKKHD